MAKLAWDQTGTRIYETGISHGVLYVYNKGIPGVGVAWNGLTTVTESPSGAESNPQYADNMKYVDIRSAEEFGATIECYTYPDEFELCNGNVELAKGIKIAQQDRKKFGMAYETLIGNDVDNTEHGRKIHLIWGATASPTEKEYASVNDSPEPISFSFELTTDLVPVEGYKPTASMTIDTTMAAPELVAKLEAKLYGSSDAEPTLPMPSEVLALLSSTPSSQSSTRSLAYSSDSTSSSK